MKIRIFSLTFRFQFQSSQHNNKSVEPLVLPSVRFQRLNSRKPFLHLGNSSCHHRTMSFHLIDYVFLILWLSLFKTQFSFFQARFQLLLLHWSSRYSYLFSSTWIFNLLVIVSYATFNLCFCLNSLSLVEGLLCLGFILIGKEGKWL